MNISEEIFYIIYNIVLKLYTVFLIFVICSLFSFTCKFCFKTLWHSSWVSHPACLPLLSSKTISITASLDKKILSSGVKLPAWNYCPLYVLTKSVVNFSVGSQLQKINFTEIFTPMSFHLANPLPIFVSNFSVLFTLSLSQQKFYLYNS